MSIPRCHAVVKRRMDGMIIHIFAVFMDADAAYAFAENANRWYGEFHPLTPLTVESSDILFEPPLFPEKG